MLATGAPEKPCLEEGAAVPLPAQAAPRSSAAGDDSSAMETGAAKLPDGDGGRPVEPRRVNSRFLSTYVANHSEELPYSGVGLFPVEMHGEDFASAEYTPPRSPFSSPSPSTTHGVDLALTEIPSPPPYESPAPPSRTKSGRTIGEQPAAVELQYRQKNTRLSVNRVGAASSQAMFQRQNIVADRGVYGVAAFWIVVCFFLPVRTKCCLAGVDLRSVSHPPTIPCGRTVI